MCFGLKAHAGTPRQVKWLDLLPKGQPFVDPIQALSADLQVSLVQLSAMRERRASGGQMTPEHLEAERQALSQFKAAKVDADGLLQRRTEIAKARITHASTTNPELGGQEVRLAGYLLPLEFDRKMKVSEFLLVPFVGACIHVPPPPPNQVVHVRPERPVDVSLFDAVWIEGRLTVGSITRELDLVDGSADIEVGYAMTKARVDRYKR